MAHNRSGGERGQTLPLVAFFMVSLLGICALAIDGGSWYQAKRATQNSADASALAGASELAVGWAPAQVAASSEFGKNKAAGDTAAYALQTTYIPDDTVQVTVTRQAKTFFAHIFGTSSVKVVSTARATMVNTGGGPMPWGVMKGVYLPGTTYQIYTDNSGPNNGAIRLPAWDTAGQTCTTGTVNGLGGAALYQAQITGGVVQTCPATIGQVVSTKTGNNTGPTAAGVDARCPSLQNPNAVVNFGAIPINITQPGSCQLVLLPVVEDAQTGAPIWPKTGSGDVRIVSWSWWVIKDYANGGKVVDAVYVGPAPVDPGAGGNLPAAYMADLSG